MYYLKQNLIYSITYKYIFIEIYTYTKKGINLSFGQEGGGHEPQTTYQYHQE